MLGTTLPLSVNNPSTNSMHQRRHECSLSKAAESRFTKEEHLRAILDLNPSVQLSPPNSFLDQVFLTYFSLLLEFIQSKVL